jgi:hypothetical protein
MGWVAQASNGSDSVPLEAVWITAGAVVLGAIIAAVAAHLRLQATLKAERVRLDDQLEAERARLDQQLEHDRELTDLAELRTLLEGVIADVLAASDAYSDLAHVYEKELATPVDRQAEEERRLERTKWVRPAGEAALRVSLDQLRVETRLPSDHAVVDALRDMRNAFRVWPDAGSFITTEMVEAHRASVRELVEAQSGLIHRLPGDSRLPPSD